MNSLKNLAIEFAATKSLLNTEMTDIKGGGCYRRTRTYSGSCTYNTNNCIPPTPPTNTCGNTSSGGSTGGGTPVVITD